MNEQAIIQAIISAHDQAHAKNSNGNGGPWWSKSLWMLGPLAIISLLLVLQSAGFLPSPVREDLSTLLRRSDHDTFLLRSLCIISATREKMNSNALCNPQPQEDAYGSAYFPSVESIVSVSAEEP